MNVSQYFDRSAECHFQAMGDYCLKTTATKNAVDFKYANISREEVQAFVETCPSCTLAKVAKKKKKKKSSRVPVAVVPPSKRLLSIKSKPIMSRMGTSELRHMDAQGQEEEAHLASMLHIQKARNDRVMYAYI